MEQKSISVIVTDMRMPVMDGLVLLRIVREKFPRTIRMVLSGYTQLSQVLATVNQGEIFQFNSKPWQMEEELLSSVRQAIERYNIETEKLFRGSDNSIVTFFIHLKTECISIILSDLKRQDQVLNYV